MKFIATSDWHLHSMRPMCRTDEDWVASQQQCLDQLAEYAIENEYPVFISGDIFDTPTVTPTVLNMMMGFMIQLIQEGIHVDICAGNHDLPYHQWERVVESSYGALHNLIRTVRTERATAMDDDCIVGREHFGTQVQDDAEYDILMLHKFAVEDERDRPPMRESWTAAELLDKYPNARIIIVGDNHMPWSKKVGDRLVVNCGTLFRRNIKELSHPTGFWVVDTDTLETTHVPFFVDYEKAHIDTTYSEVEKDRALSSKKYEALIAQLKDGVENDYDFLSTLTDYVKTNEDGLGEPVVAFLEEVIDYIKKENE